MQFEIKEQFHISPLELYELWLSSEGHSNMTGGEAHCTDEIGENFDAWDGYISGTNLELEKGKRIKQTWRTSEFEDEEANSIIEITLEDVEGSCQLSLKHSNLPEHGLQYKDGWVEHYFEPIKAYIESLELKG